MKAKSENFVFRTYSSIDEVETVRRKGMEIFIEDYRKGSADGRYRFGLLPRVDFEDQGFDFVFCAHFLFIYSGQFDFEFHRKAIAELYRLAREEVRIHPIVDAAGQPYPLLKELMVFAGEFGFEGEIQLVDHEFYKGANQTLVLTCD